MKKKGKIEMQAFLPNIVKLMLRKFEPDSSNMFVFNFLSVDQFLIKQRSVSICFYLTRFANSCQTLLEIGKLNFLNWYVLDGSANFKESILKIFSNFSYDRHMAKINRQTLYCTKILDKKDCLFWISELSGAGYIVWDV